MKGHTRPPSVPPILYSVMTGATGVVAGKQGLVPAPAAGDQAKFLRGDGTWVATSGYTDPLTTNGDILIRAGGVTTRLGIGTAGQVLTVSGGLLPAWAGVYQDPLTTNGDILIRAGGVTTRLAIGSTGDVLTVTGGLPVWAAAGGATPAGADTQIQYNAAGVFGASSGLTWNDTTKTLTLTGTGGTGSTLAVTIPVSAVTGVAITSNATANYGLTVNDAGLPVNALAAFTGVDTSTNAVAAYLGARPAITGISTLFWGGFFVANAAASTPIGMLVQTSSTNTNTIDAMAIYARSTGTAAASFGARIGVYLESSTTNDVFAGSINWYWTTATHVSRTSAFKIVGVSNAVTTDYVTVTSGGMTLGTGLGLTVNRSTGGGNVVDITSGGSGNALQITASSGVPFRADDSASNVGFNWYKTTALTAMYVQSLGIYSSASTSLVQFVLAGASTTTDVAALTLSKSYNASLNAAVHNLLRIANDTTTASAPAAGFGLAVDWIMRTASSSTRVSVANMAAVYTDPTTGSEDADFVFTLMKAGAMTEAVRIIGTGAIRIGTASAYVAHQPSSGTTTYTWPTGYPPSATGYYLTSNTTGTLSWAAVSGMSNPMTTNGDMIYQAAGVPARLPIGTAGHFMVTNGSAPTWTDSVSASPTASVLTLRNTNGSTYTVLTLGTTSDASTALVASSGGAAAATFQSVISGAAVTITNGNSNPINQMYDIVTVQRSGGAGLAGGGGRIKYILENDTSAVDAGGVGIIWEDAANATYTSAFVVQLARSAGALATVLNVSGDGDITSTNTTATTNAAVTVATTTLATTGTAANGLATRHLWQIEDSGGNLSDAAAWDVAWSDATAASEDAVVEIRVAAGGTLAKVVTVGSAFVDVNSASGEYRVNGTKVVSARITGWATATGTATRSTFDTTTVTTSQLAERVKALIDDLFTHGLINT